MDISGQGFESQRRKTNKRFATTRPHSTFIGPSSRLWPRTTLDKDAKRNLCFVISFFFFFGKESTGRSIRDVDSYETKRRFAMVLQPW